MKPLALSHSLALALCAALPAQASPPSVWNSDSSPALPLRYAEPIPNLQTGAPQIAHAETYAPQALHDRLYPSIAPGESAESENIPPEKLSKTREFIQFATRGNLSPSYVQEFAYIDAYSDIRKPNDFFGFPSIRMNLAMPRFGNGLATGYRPLQFGFGPMAILVW